MPSLRELATEVARRLCTRGYRAIFAGGCVRDHLLGREPKDYDIATIARPEQVLEIYPHAVLVGVQFGVVRVHHRGKEFEVATFRREGAYLDGRRPSEVAFSDEREDALRRDFTINGMFLDPETGEVIDYVGGRADLAARVVRAIGDPRDRFREDHLRLLRAVRFAAGLGFAIDPATEAAIREMAHLIGMVSAERVRDELWKLLAGPDPRRGVELLDATGLLAHIFPEVVAMKGVPQPLGDPPGGDVWTHTLHVLGSLERPTPELAVAALLHDIGKPKTLVVAERIRFERHAEVGAEMAEEVCRRLKCSTSETETVTALVRDHMKFLNVRDMRVSTLKRFLREPHFEALLALHKADCPGCHRDLSNWEYCLEKREELARRQEPLRPEPLLTGHDLIGEGYAPGPRFGEILAAVEDAQLEGTLRTREEALAFVRERFPKEGA